MRNKRINPVTSFRFRFRFSFVLRAFNLQTNLKDGPRGRLKSGIGLDRSYTQIYVYMYIENILYKMLMSVAKTAFGGC